MIYFVIALAGAFISAMIASAKNRSAVGWGMLGFFFPLIGVIVACCLPAHAPLDQSAAVEPVRWQR